MTLDENYSIEAKYQALFSAAGRERKNSGLFGSCPSGSFSRKCSALEISGD